VRAPLAWFGPGRLVEHAAVVIEGGAVRYAGRRLGAPEADDEIRVDGFLMPAVADRHVHVTLSDPGAVLLGGVTAVRDLGGPPAEVFPLADASELPSYLGPVIRAAGPILTAPDGYPTREPDLRAGTALEVRGPEHAGDVVADLAGRGAAAIKVALNAEAGPTPSDAELAAICAAAESAGLPVTVHAQGSGQVERAIGGGVAELAHAPFSERLSDGVVAGLASGTRVVSTLHLIAQHAGTDVLKVALDNARRFVDAGGVLVYGTDLGPPAWDIPPGIDLHEAQLLAQCGLTVEGVLGAMILAPLEPGSPGDVVALGGDPLRDLATLGDVRLVVRQGRVVRR
jgi:imidazolonepropionase-like amidohydrolase